jgi:hypothetical protein
VGVVPWDGVVEAGDEEGYGALNFVYDINLRDKIYFTRATDKCIMTGLTGLPMERWRATALAGQSNFSFKKSEIKREQPLSRTSRNFPSIERNKSSQVVADVKILIGSPTVSFTHY